MVRRGFTLIELLILLALTALLMSMLLPALALGRKQAVAMECQSNIRQTAFLRYSPAFDRWGDSAYDLNDGDDSFGKGGGESGGDRKPNDIENGDDPMRARDQYKGDTRSQISVPYDSWLESQSQGQPQAWSLVCPVAEQNNENSYGISVDARLAPFDRVASPDDVIFGCSVVKVVISIESFDYRHLDRASILFGDLHVKPMAFNDFSNRMALPFERH